MIDADHFAQVVATAMFNTRCSAVIREGIDVQVPPILHVQGNGSYRTIMLPDEDPNATIEGFDDPEFAERIRAHITDEFVVTALALICDVNYDAIHVPEEERTGLGVAAFVATPTDTTTWLIPYRKENGILVGEPARQIMWQGSVPFAVSLLASRLFP